MSADRDRPLSPEEADRLRGLNALVGDGYSQPCFVCLGILGKHESWCDSPTARRAPAAKP